MILYPDSWRFAEFPLVTKFLFFFVYGFVKREDFLNFTKRKKDLVVWSLITFVYLILALFDPDIFYNVRLFYGVALFNLFFFIQQYLSNIPYVSKILTWLGKNSLWIYLIHFSLTEAMYLLLAPHFQNYYALFFVTFIGATMVTIPFAYILNRTYSKFEKLTN